MHEILIVEDELAIADMLSLILERESFRVRTTHSIAQAQQALIKLPDLVILDWMLPDGSGTQLAEFIRKYPRSQTLPIIMLTARAEEEDKVRALGLGVDDYLTKPFSPRELLARIRAVLRRSLPTTPSEIHFGHLIIYPALHAVKVGTTSLKLTPREYALLYFFVTHPERIYSREALITHLWDNWADIDERSVDALIRRLRSVLRAAKLPEIIHTVRGAGYVCKQSKDVAC
jgi:two-component system phosphate regulon response regulator PhoB